MMALDPESLSLLRLDNGGLPIAYQRSAVRVEDTPRRKTIAAERWSTSAQVYLSQAGSTRLQRRPSGLRVGHQPIVKCHFDHRFSWASLHAFACRDRPNYHSFVTINIGLAARASRWGSPSPAPGVVPSARGAGPTLHPAVSRHRKLDQRRHQK
jgi:hypothetical protein